MSSRSRNRTSHHLRHAFLPSPKNNTHLLQLTLSLLFLATVAAAANLSDDLLNFKSSLPDPSVLSGWNPSIPPCSFTGVTCSTSRITSIDLTSIPLSTTLTSVAAHLLSSPSLSTLQSLTLKFTNLSGPLSPPLTTCPESLTNLDLSNNHLTATPGFPSYFSACSSLSSLNLSSNDLIHSPTDDPTLRKTRFSLLPNLQTLDFSSNQLGGGSFLPWILTGACSTSKLKRLFLRNNKLTDRFSLHGCDGLEYLDLSANNFSTPIPDLGSCASLQHLDLSSNKFNGIIPPSTLKDCDKLTYLNISNNEFTGQLPTFPTSNLQFLYLSSNQFVGGFARSGLVSACPTLVEIDLSSNNLTGDIPTGFELCSSLQTFDLSHNNLTGSLPITIFLKMNGLKRLALSFNRFTGELPDSLSSLTGLTTLDLSANNFSGKIPSNLCQSTKTSLRELYLQDNSLSGPIPSDLGNCSELVSLDLSFNKITGTIPGSFGSLSKLKDLIMWMNQLEGSIPEELMYIRSLENLILDYNRLSGSIPSGLRNCSNLNWISLSSNLLSGVIPSWIGELVNLAILKLSDNAFHGSIPAEMGDCKSLLWVDLNSNLLNGTIPSTLAKQSGKLAVGLVVGKEYVYIRNVGGKECHGSGNLYEFAGIRTDSLGNLPSRHKCNVTRPYRGNTQPNFQHNGTMMFLDLSHNLLEGSIPKELGSMYYLQILNLAHNQLTGPIPDEFGGMKTVGVMDLSNNQLFGRIPSSLTSLSLLTELDLSNNNLSGQIPDSGQFETFSAASFHNNSGLCGYPLPKCGKNASSDGSHQQKGRSRGTLAGSVAMGLLFSLFCIFGMIIVYVELRKRKMRKRKEEEALEAGGNGNLSNSGGGVGLSSTAWKLTGAREALSINLSTFDNPLRKLTFADLLEATNGFHNDFMIGSGGFGDVYRAKLKDGSVVAIKKLIHVSGQGDREFTAEMETIGTIKHRNLVPLLGYCKVGDERLLVYEYMKYGSLDDVLHEPKKAGITLNWAARRKIAIGAARGLAFLHHNCAPHIIHRDMKSSNVLLDENLEARVSDFGMARMMSAMDTHLSVSTLAGTPGYVPPEYYQSFRCSTSGDVYSYGVVLLELLTGKQPTDSADFGDNNLVGWVKLHAKARISDVFDPVLIKEDPGLEIELLQHLKVACACLDDRPRRRPTMIQVMAMFKEIQAGSGLDSGTTATTVDGDDHGSCFTGSFSTVDGGLDMSMKEIPEGEKLH